MNKNWKKIAGCGNDQLRALLISAENEIKSGLEIGFPGYFLLPGESQEKLAKDEFLRVADELRGSRQGLIDFCTTAGIPVKQFRFEGHCCGSTPGVSYAKGGYQTTANGWGDHFYRSSLEMGDAVEYEGATWMVARNGYASGDASTFASHSLVLVPVKALAD